MSVRTVLMLAAVLSAAGLTGGCSSRVDPTPTEAAPAPQQEDQLTAEGGKEALLDAMRAREGEFQWFDAARWSGVPLEQRPGGWYALGDTFQVNPYQAVYTLTIFPRPGLKGCVFHYHGSIVRKDGRWSAAPPELDSTDLQARE
jgi:hypothetical protein